jgi:Smg protein
MFASAAVRRYIDDEPMFDVLVYLFENCAAFQACRDADSITRQLAEAGFDDEEITDAIAWLRDLDQVTSDNVALRAPSAGAFRVYAGFEVGRLTPRGIAFLAFLETEGQLTPTQREIVIERALAVREVQVALAKLKVIVLMVLWSQQADIDALMLEELLDDGVQREMH